MGKSSSEHVHVGDPCVICALYDIFIALSMATKNNRREAVAPTSLRVALSNLYPDSNFFQEVTPTTAMMWFWYNVYARENNFFGPISYPYLSSTLVDFHKWIVL